MNKTVSPKILLPISASSLIADLLINDFTTKLAITSLSLLALSAPVVAGLVAKRRKLTCRSIAEALSKEGIEARMEDNQVIWEADGKVNMARINDCGQLQVARKYNLESKSYIDVNEKAAVATTGEVYSVKVGVVRRNEDEGFLVFASESLCPTGGVFNKVFFSCMKALDEAEHRQRDNLKTVLAEKAGQRRKIGFK